MVEPRDPRVTKNGKGRRPTRGPQGRNPDVVGRDGSRSVTRVETHTRETEERHSYKETERQYPVNDNVSNGSTFRSCFNSRVLTIKLV